MAMIPLIGAQQVWAYFLKNKFTKAALATRSSDIAWREMAGGSRYHNSRVAGVASDARRGWHNSSSGRGGFAQAVCPGSTGRTAGFVHSLRP
jgi:hypothetical protein